MSSNGIYYVSLLNGNDSSKGTLTNPLKNLDVAINRSVSGDQIYVSPGTYRPLQINNCQELFEIHLEGDGSNAYCQYLSFIGSFEASFKKLKIGGMLCQLFKSHCKFEETIHQGFTQMVIALNSENTEENLYIFTRATFNQSFQIVVQGGKSCFIFTECLFKGDYPIISAEYGEIHIKIISCYCKNSICYNHKAKISLESVNTILPSILSFGAPLEDSQKSVILINSNDHPIYNCTQNLKFLEIQGTVPITLVLSEIIKHGYVLEIYSTVPVIINGQKYSESSFKIRRLEKSWILYNNTAVSIEIL